MRFISSAIILIILVFGFKNTVGSEQNIKPSPVYGKIINNCLVYDNIDGKAINMLEKNTCAEIIKDRSTKWYYIKFTGMFGWIKAENIYIPPDTPTNTKQLSDITIEKYAKENFKSNTDYFVWVDIDRQRVYVLKNKLNWQVLKRIVCATGVNKSPTVRGYFALQDRGTWFYSKRLGSGAKYWVRFNESYLFHSVAMDEKGNVTDGTLGEKRSSGCVRMSIEDARWFYENLPEGTGVFVN